MLGDEHEDLDLKNWMQRLTLDILGTLLLYILQILITFRRWCRIWATIWIREGPRRQVSSTPIGHFAALILSRQQKAIAALSQIKFSVLEQIIPSVGYLPFPIYRTRDNFADVVKAVCNA